MVNGGLWSVDICLIWYDMERVPHNSKEINSALLHCLYHPFADCFRHPKALDFGCFATCDTVVCQNSYVTTFDVWPTSSFKRKEERGKRIPKRPGAGRVEGEQYDSTRHNIERLIMSHESWVMSPWVKGHELTSSLDHWPRWSKKNYSYRNWLYFKRIIYRLTNREISKVVSSLIIGLVSESDFYRTRPTVRLSGLTLFFKSQCPAIIRPRTIIRPLVFS